MATVIRRTLIVVLLLACGAAAPTLPDPAKPDPKPATKPPPPKPWAETDYGPTLSTTLECPYPTRNITQKGIIIRLDAQSQTYVLFDEDLLRYSYAWTGGFFDFHNIMF